MSSQRMTYIVFPMVVWRVICRTLYMYFYPCRLSTSSGTRTAFPMVVAPEATTKCLYLVVGSNTILSVATILCYFLFSSGARPALPMGVAPEHMISCLRVVICSSNSSAVSSLIAIYMSTHLGDFSPAILSLVQNHCHDLK